jgi:hypothetical protein
MHPLFSHGAQTLSTKTLDIGFIQVRRRDLQRGGWTPVLQTFRADELTTIGAIADLFGGGDYELIGRCRRNRRIASRVKVWVAGVAKAIGEVEPTPLAATEDGHDKSGDGSGPARDARQGHEALRRRRSRAERLQEQLERGSLHAKAFRLFSKKTPLPRVVCETKLPLEEVRRLWLAYITPPKNAADEELERHAEQMLRMANEEERERQERWRADRERDRERARLVLLERWLRLREREVELQGRRSSSAQPGSNHPTSADAAGRAQEHDRVAQAFDEVFSRLGTASTARGRAHSAGPG